MAVTVTTKEGYGSRIGNSFKGILSGFVCIIAGIVLLWWNEGRTVKRTKALNEGGKAVISVPSSSVDAANEGKLIHTTGMTEVGADLIDSDFGITIPKGIMLQRIVEMYQWAEESKTTEEKKLGGSVEKTTVYTYSKTWADHIIDSSSFQEQGHDNPAIIPVLAKKNFASSVMLGAFKLTDSQIQSIGQSHDYIVPSNLQLPKLPDPSYDEGRIMNGQIYYAVRTKDIAAELKEKAVNAVADAAVEKVNEAVTGQETVVQTQTINAAQIGDIRISFRVVEPHDISIVAQQAGNTFCAYQAKTGTISLQTDGIQSAEQMFESAKSANKFLAWLLRFIGFFLIYSGFQSIFKFASVLADVVPFIGNIVGMATSFISFLLALPLTLIVIAIAWLFYRPVLSIILLVVVVGSVIALLKAFPKKKVA